MAVHDGLMTQVAMVSATLLLRYFGLREYCNLSTTRANDTWQDVSMSTGYLRSMPLKWEEICVWPSCVPGCIN